jgi:hypothetical protein
VTTSVVDKPKAASLPVHVVQMMPAAPGMYAIVGKDDRSTEYRLIVMWVLLDNGDGSQDIIGLTSKDIASGDIMHQGYEHYTTQVPKESANVTITR